MVTLTRERSDWIFSKGYNVALEVGPFGFYLDTADGFEFSWGITVRNRYIGWRLGRYYG